LAAWRRDHEDDASSESDVERAARDAAATLALIGLAIEERGLRLSDGRVRVFLHAEDVAAVVATAQALSNQCALIGRTVPNLRLLVPLTSGPVLASVGPGVRFRRSRCGCPR
jgi:hypothetical protein